MASPLAHLRAIDERRAAERADVDDRLVALHRAGVRDVASIGGPTPGDHGALAVTFTHAGEAHVVEAATWAVALDRMERIVGCA